MGTKKPFAEAADELRKQRGISGRRLAAKSGISQSAVSVLLLGELRPSMEAIERIAKALDVEPEYFAEYRLDKRRDELDWRTRPLDRALKALGE